MLQRYDRGMNHPQPVTGLSIQGCLARQHRLREQMAMHDLDAVLLATPVHVNYLTRYWARSILERVVRDGLVTVVLPREPEEELVADRTLVFESSELNTLVDDQQAAALRLIEKPLSKVRRLGCDGGLRAGLSAGREVIDFEPAMRQLRRRKEGDEVALLSRAIAAAEAALKWARQTLSESIDEVELYAGMLAAATDHAGETLGEFGNDFQIGDTGSAPRRRRPRNGEIAIYDVGVILRGYHSDMCRSFVVGGQPSDAQRYAHARIMAFHQYVQQNMRAGRSCRVLYEHAHEMLDGYRGWSFPHHLGHGIGITAHQSPRLNPRHDDTLEVGDVVAIEPGLYHEELRAGLRIEEIYHVTETGLAKLTRFPTDW